MSLLSLATPVIGLIKSVIASSKHAASKAASAADSRAASLTGLVIITIWCYPFISSFMPVLSAHTAAGFDVVAKYPDWYVENFVIVSLGFLGLVGVVRGIRQ